MCYALKRTMVRSPNTRFVFNFVPHTHTPVNMIVVVPTSFVELFLFLIFFYRVVCYRDRFEEKLAQRT